MKKGATGILITARMGSSRLRHKHMLPVAGKTMISVLLSRIAHEFRHEIEIGAAKIIIATSEEPENRAFESLKSSEVDVFYGSNDNIPLRHLQAADAFGLSAVVSVDGDDPLCSPKAMRAVYEELQRGSKYVKTENLPLGMNVSGYSAVCLREAVEKAGQGMFETGWFRIFDPTDIKKVTVPFSFNGNASVLRLTLDYDQDYQFFKSVIEDFGDQIVSATDEQIADRATSKGYYQLNCDLNEVYFNNFYKKMSEEQKTPENQV